VAELPQPAAVGRVRGLHLLHGLAAVLVHGPHPDLATLRDRAKSKVAYYAYGMFALGWRGANRHWQNYEKAYLILAGLSTPLVLSVHTIVSFDFATSVIPGWHTTIFPPYFVAGAIFSGFAMVLTLAIPARKIFKLEEFITVRHVENMNKIILVTGMMVGYAYAMEFFIAWYSGSPTSPSPSSTAPSAPTGGPTGSWWSCNVITPQLFWFQKIRQNMTASFILSIFVNIGMWFERFVITMSLHRDFMPVVVGLLPPDHLGRGLSHRVFGLFFTLFLLFLKFLPAIAIAEVKGVMPQADPHWEGYHADHHHSADHAHAAGEKHHG
jgi:hypothetical protein